MGNIPLGQGVVGIPTIIEELKRIGFDGPTTLEVAGEHNVRASLSSLRQWTATRPAKLHRFQQRKVADLNSTF